MDTNFRNKDLTKVFDESWKANHNSEFFKREKEKQQQFTNKLYKPSDQQQGMRIDLTNNRGGEIRNRLGGN